MISFINFSMLLNREMNKIGTSVVENYIFFKNILLGKHNGMHESRIVC